MATFNSKEYEWSDVTVAVDGNVLGAITGVSYTRSKEKEFIYGRGSKPRAIQSGNETIEGSITLLQTDFEALNDASKNAGYGSILDPSFTINISYTDTAGVPRVDTLKFVEFSEYPKGMAQNDKMMEIEMPFLALGLEENV